MLTLLSPAKTQDFDQPIKDCQFTIPEAKKEIATLVGELRHYRPSQIKNLMSVSDKLAELNYQRFQMFTPNQFDLHNAVPAIFAFKGDAYQSLAVENMEDKAIDFMQDHLVILSGLYGYLRPLDLIQPYRLEMKTPLKNAVGKNLYAFWGDKIAKAINKTLKSHTNKIIINLASQEYFKAIDLNTLTAPVITVHFKERSGRQLKVIGIHAKRARGMMTRYIMNQKIDTPTALQQFTEGNYQFAATLSDETDYIFVR